MFLSRNKKSNVYPCKPQFYYIKVGFDGSKLYRHVFVMISDFVQTCSLVSLVSDTQVDYSDSNNKYQLYVNSATCSNWLIVFGLTTRRPLWAILCRLPEVGRREIDSRGDEREGQGRKRKMSESEETEEIKTFPSTLTCCKDSRPCPAVSQSQLYTLVTQDIQHVYLTKPPKLFPPKRSVCLHGYLTTIFFSSCTNLN